MPVQLQDCSRQDRHFTTTFQRLARTSSALQPSFRRGSLTSLLDIRDKATLTTERFATIAMEEQRMFCASLKTPRTPTTCPWISRIRGTQHTPCMCFKLGGRLASHGGVRLNIKF